MDKETSKSIEVQGTETPDNGADTGNLNQNLNNFPDADSDSSSLPAESRPLAAESPATQPEPQGAPEMIPRSQADELCRKAFIEGRNSAIRESAPRQPMETPFGAVNLTPGIDDPLQPPADPTLARLFAGRPHVW